MRDSEAAAADDGAFKGRSPRPDSDRAHKSNEPTTNAGENSVRHGVPSSVRGLHLSVAPRQESRRAVVAWEHSRPEFPQSSSDPAPVPTRRSPEGGGGARPEASFARRLLRTPDFVRSNHQRFGPFIATTRGATRRRLDRGSDTFIDVGGGAVKTRHRGERGIETAARTMTDELEAGSGPSLAAPQIHAGSILPGGCADATFTIYVSLTCLL
jgi:hypothetical protein